MKAAESVEYRAIAIPLTQMQLVAFKVRASGMAIWAAKGAAAYGAEPPEVLSIKDLLDVFGEAFRIGRESPIYDLRILFSESPESTVVRYFPESN